MRLKSFHARSMGDAMRQVRAAMGDDAIIVATHEDGSGVRVTAAIDDIQAPLSDPASDLADIIGEALQRHGVPAALIERLAWVPENRPGLTPAFALAEALRGVLRFDPVPRSGRRRLMLIGPPGAGKTLSTAKLAAEAVMKGQRIAVLSADTVRAGGIEQLAAFTRLMRVELVPAGDAQALAHGVAEAASAEMTLIDSPGCNPFDPADIAAMAELIAASRAVPAVVLPAGGDPVESAMMAKIFAAFGAKRLIATRLDVSRRLGGILAAADAGSLALADAGDTPQVASGLTPLSAEWLAERLLSGSDGMLPGYRNGTSP